MDYVDYPDYADYADCRDLPEKGGEPPSPEGLDQPSRVPRYCAFFLRCFMMFSHEDIERPLTWAESLAVSAIDGAHANIVTPRR